MITAELRLGQRPTVLVQRDDGASVGAWARLETEFARGIVSGSAAAMEIRADVFFAELDVVRQVRTMFRQEVILDPALTRRLRLMAADRRARELVTQDVRHFDAEALERELEGAGFRRQLKDFQLENLARLLQLPHGADFSVPGAGKTTVALASFAVSRARGLVDKLLVVGPLASFDAWRTDAAACFASELNVAVHSGPDSFIPQNVDLLLTSYHRLVADYDRVAAYVSGGATQVVLDEAHRIKRGATGVHGQAALDLAYSARRRDVLTGTPAPQGAYDLIALMRFLYPGQDRQILPDAAYVEKDGREGDVLAATSASINRYFVRTPKSRLQLPPTSMDVVVQSMRPIQAAIYDAMVGRYRSEFPLDVRDRRRLDAIGRVTMYLLEAAVNPMLLVAGADADDEAGFAHPPLEVAGDERLADLLRRYGDYETPWKYDHVMNLVATAAQRGEKVLVWSSFVRNLKALARLLSDFSPAVVHGGVPPEDLARPGVVSRESEFDRFRSDPACSVLLANPAACGEGVSLHHWCHHAVYIDRTFNAGHFLQSQDRIHRLGLADDTVTNFTLLISARSIDEAVDGRLREKVVALGQLMNDPGLVRVSLPEPDTRDVEKPVYGDDVQAVREIMEAWPGGVA